MVTMLTCYWKRFDASVHLPVCVTLGMITCVALEVFYLLLQEQGPVEDQFRAVHILLFSILLVNMLANMMEFMRTNPSIKGVFLTDCSVGQGWDYCYFCETHIPPRCHHCFTCNVCVLRRDHHCVLLGRCQGYANYRYLIGLLIYSWIGLLYASILNAGNLMGILHEGISTHSLFLLVMPWLMLLTGQVSVSAFIFVFISDVCLVSFLFCSGFLALHTALLLRGATCKEWFSVHNQYDLGWQGNVKDFLGTRWFLIWLFPWVSSPLPGDGIHFKTRSLPVQQPLKNNH
ncbi:probable palmitoyltransferase ZDHHC24 [Ambystoma mexicanum]|uniref:probable palmitoyltransferase ZDHHC24 n=1 Tax=Ambystoma mexicanum TaxID=8296 RepID=UPI0037E74B15